MPQTSFSERLSLAIGGESIHAFAKRAEIPDSTLRQYLNKGSMPGVDKLLQLSEAAGVTLDWLAAERGPMRFEENASGPDFVIHGPGSSMTAVEAKRFEEQGADMVFVPRLEVSASAGHGSLWLHEQAIELVAFQSAWLRALGVNPNFARIITARGDSMEETIRDGDLLLIDTSVNEVRDNGIYCVVYGNILLVKRIHMRLNGSVQLISDNPIYPPEEVTTAEVQQLAIAGRVMWFGRSI